MGLALWSALATLFTFWGLSFRSLCVAFSCALPIALVLSIRSPLVLASPVVPEREALEARWMLFGLCLLGAVLCLLHHEPIPDEAYYFGGRTIYFLAHPDAALDLVHHDHALLDWPVHFPLLILQHVSLLWAYVALVTGLSALDVLHYVAPVLGGLLLPIAWYMALSRFVRSPLAALTGTAAIVAWLCLEAVGSHGFGRFGFPMVRLGKGMLMAVYLPIFVAWSMDWFERPGARAAARLVLVTIACAGLSESSLFLLPVLACFLACGALFARGATLATARNLLGYFATPVWLYGIGLFIVTTLDRSSMQHLGFERRFPDTFTGQLKLVFGGEPAPMLCVYLLVLLAAGLTLRGRKQRAFLAGWLVATVALLNPLLFPLFAQRLTSFNAYWRLIHLAPFLLAVGIAIAGLVDRLMTPKAGRHLAAVALLLGLALLGNLVEPFAGRAVFARVPLALAGHKIDPRVQKDVREILAHAQPGPMLAPLRYSGVVPLYSAEHPQIAVRGIMLSHTAIACGERELARSRMRAVQFVSKQAAIPAAGPDLAELLALEELENVVVSGSVADSPLLCQLLLGHGFQRVLRRPRFSLFVRTPVP